MDKLLFFLVAVVCMFHVEHSRADEVFVGVTWDGVSPGAYIQAVDDGVAVSMEIGSSPAFSVGAAKTDSRAVLMAGFRMSGEGIGPVISARTANAGVAVSRDRVFGYVGGLVREKSPQRASPALSDDIKNPENHHDDDREKEHACRF